MTNIAGTLQNIDCREAYHSGSPWAAMRHERKNSH
jgi:hypothetical protein